MMINIWSGGRRSLCFLRRRERVNFSTKPLPKSKLKWKSVVGLEIHAQIDSESKLFSGAQVEFAAPVNANVSLFDAAIPGTLPVLNKACVQAGVSTALALACDINRVSMFDRKHYFYADLPAGYQITQQRAPLARNGQLTFPVFVPGVTKKPYKKTVRLHQLQLEQDSGKSLHDEFAGQSLVDLNRAGAPLMEFVFDPDLSDGEEAAALVKELILILTRLKTCSCKMEEGALRVDANVSVHEEGTALGTRTEIKNIGSVRGVAHAITYEIARQIEILENGGRIHNETRSWDASSKTTVAMRDKEVLQDYRFMPEPNLPPLRLTEENFQQNLPELPEETREKLTKDLSLPSETAIILVNEDNLLRLFFEISNEKNDLPSKIIANILTNELLTIFNKNKMLIEECAIPSKSLGDLITMLHEGEVNLQMLRLILQELFEKPHECPNRVAEANNWKQISDEKEIEALCEETLAANPKLVAAFRAGKTKVFYAIVGEVAKKSENRANMSLVAEKLKKMLK
ncbi:glutamyl-tRNA(Gln) amidotransferase subunit B, mitochondrial [Phlebotomus argentipes]|uniref:glutamyl-tRNA(Gln) amidotransferase subunit B, mitochondrial n=1 Tax=Phlebotomus argentipes TaxID=94469 RepID=UPI0028935B48|nr:glutamyl-tRNA(Gln) amidotransferase subunit B, mitochondrial [Phlebotomus argentipes]